MSVSLPGAFARDVARQLGVVGFWRWWADQLGGLVPAKPRAAWQRRRMHPVLAFDANRATVWRPVVRDGRLDMLETAAIPLDGSTDEVAAAGRAALASLPRTGTGVVVTLALPARSVLRKDLVLPMAIEENLRQAVGYDLDRHTPFKPDELYYDTRVVGRDPARGVLRVELVAARRSIVDPLLRHAEGWGATVARVSADGPDAAGTAPFNLLDPERRPIGAPWRRWQFWLPFVLLAAFVVAATVLPVWQKRGYAIALGELVERARQQAAVSETLRAEIDRQVADYNFALERKFTYPPTVQILDDVSRLMPDDTWLTQLELRTSRGKELQRELSLRGESANAGRLVSVLEESRLFTQAAPRSPTTKIQPGPGEIFDVGAQLKPLAPPAAAPVLVASAAPGAAVPLAPSTMPAAPSGPAATTAATAPARAPQASAPTAGAPAASAPAQAPASPPPSTAAAPAPGQQSTPATAPSTPASTPTTPPPAAGGASSPPKGAPVDPGTPAASGSRARPAPPGTRP